MKKIISIVLAVVLMCSFVLPVMGNSAVVTAMAETAEAQQAEENQPENEKEEVAKISAKFFENLIRFLERVNEFLRRIFNIATEDKEHHFVRGLDEAYHWQVCDICGEVQFKSDHIFGESVVTKEPDCFNDGESCRACVVCGYEVFEKIDRLEHDELIIPGKAPTETESGLTAGKICKLCNTVTLEQFPIPALGTN